LVLGIIVYCCCCAKEQKYYVDDGEGEEGDEYADDYGDDYFASEAVSDYNDDYGEEATYYDDFPESTQAEESFLGSSFQASHMHSTGSSAYSGSRY
jgi:hypothetical protein